MATQELVTTTPAVLDRVTGEVLDLADATLEQLAAWSAHTDDLRGQLADDQALVNAALLAHLDRDATRTKRVGDPAAAVQFEVKAPSPEAGTSGWDAVKLDALLARLITDKTISPDGAAKALDRQVTVVLRVPFGADPDELVKQVLGSPEVKLADVVVEVVKADSARKPVQAGLKALSKVPGVAAALEKAQVALPAPARRVKVTVKRKEVRP